MAAADSHDSTLSPQVEKLAGQLAKDPRSRAFIPLAEEYAKAGMLQEAATVLEDGLKVYPTFVTALVALGRVYVQMDQTPKALGILEEAVKISPDNVLAHRILARLYVKQMSYDLARRSCDRVLFEYPKDQEMLQLRSEIDAPAPAQPAAPAPATPPPDVTPVKTSPTPHAVRPAPAAAGTQTGAIRAERVAAVTRHVEPSARPAAAAPGPALVATPAPLGTAGPRPAVDARIERLQSLLARIRSRRPS